MAPKGPSPTSDDEIVRLRAERDTAFRQLADLRTDLQELTRVIAGQNDRLDQVVSMLRRREEQLKRAQVSTGTRSRALSVNTATKTWRDR